jgi:hypothetical protein
MKVTAGGTAAAVTAIAAATLVTPAHATTSQQPISQTAALNWHAQSGNEGPVGEGAEATLERTADGVSYQITTHSLVPGDAYTVWFVVVNDPAACADSPCTPPEILGEPTLDGQVTWGLDGQVADDDGNATFAADVAAGPLLDGWLPVQGLDNPLAAEIHLVLNDHGPVIEDMRDEMLSSYRAGCSDDSPFPDIFPDTALADGTPGPNTCQLYQSATFQPPSSTAPTRTGGP